jgi:putative solute:sodium symporter small subunit
MSNKTNIEAHWKKTSGLLKIVLAFWFFFAYVLHFFVGSLNEISFIGFPLGYYMAAQGSLFAFVVIIYFFAKKQNQIDEEFGLAEIDEE